MAAANENVDVAALASLRPGMPMEKVAGSECGCIGCPPQSPRRPLSNDQDPKHGATGCGPEIKPRRHDNTAQPNGHSAWCVRLS